MSIRAGRAARWRALRRRPSSALPALAIVCDWDATKTTQAYAQGTLYIMALRQLSGIRLRLLVDLYQFVSPKLLSNFIKSSVNCLLFVIFHMKFTVIIGLLINFDFYYAFVKIHFAFASYTPSGRLLMKGKILKIVKFHKCLFSAPF